jgi:hypothetical protein
MHGGMEVLLHSFLTLELDGDEENIYTFQLLYPATKSSYTHSIGGWLFRRTGMNIEGN